MAQDAQAIRLKLMPLAAGVLLLCLAGFIYAEPVMDGDLWFHLAYGRYMVENRTLVPDHTIYSWTPADNSTIYCAWIPEITLYAIHAWGGLAGLFALRYACLLAFLVLVFLAMARSGSASHPVAWVVAIMGVLTVQVAMQIKPELFSLAFFSLTVWAWAMIRLTRGHARFYCYLIPAVMLLWVNSHGGFVFGLFFVGLVAAGEGLSILLGLSSSLDRRTAGHFFLGMALTVAAVFITPYGWAYPAQLFSELVLHQGDQLQEFRTVMAYQSILHPNAQGLHLVEYMALAAMFLAGLFWGSVRRRRWILALALAALGMGVLATQFIRTTYFWGVFVVFASLLMLGQQEQVAGRHDRGLPRYVGVFCVALCVLMAGREGYHALCKPLSGFWVNYYSPVHEAEYIRTHLKGTRVGNNYNSGAYLLWALWPGQKVFIDARYFPYRQWYREYGDAMYGRDDRARDAFLTRYGCDAWCTTYEYDHLSFFVHSPEWQLALYGPSACIFVRKGRGFSPDADPCHPAVFTVKPHQKMRILDFMVMADDLDHAYAMAMTLEACRLCPSRNVQAAAGCVKAGEALGRAGRTDDAIACFERATAIRPDQGPEVLTVLGNLYLKKGDQSMAITSYQRALEVKPDYAPAMGNAASAYSMQGAYDTAFDLLSRLREIRPDDPEVEYNMACLHARQGRVDEAVSSLKAAVEKGFNDRELLRTDPDLEGLRETEFYRELVQ